MPNRHVVRYGASSSQFVDVWEPVGPVRGTAAVIHGGWWRDKHDLHLMDAICSDLAGRGWLAGNIEFRRTGHDGGGWPHTLTDVLGGISVLDLSTGKPKIAIGHSAGGHLGLLAAAHGAVDAVVALAPITDPARCARERLGEDAVVPFMGAGPDEAPETYAVASPLNRLPLRRPQLVVHGLLDQRVPIDHSRVYVAHAREVGDPVDYAEVADADHFVMTDPNHPAWQTTIDWIG